MLLLEWVPVVLVILAVVRALAVIRFSTLPRSPMRSATEAQYPVLLREQRHQQVPRPPALVEPRARALASLSTAAVMVGRETPLMLVLVVVVVLRVCGGLADLAVD